MQDEKRSDLKQNWNWNHFDKKNIASIDKMIEENPVPAKAYRMKEASNQDACEVKITRESRKTCAKILVK